MSRFFYSLLSSFGIPVILLCNRNDITYTTKNFESNIYQLINQKLWQIIIVNIVDKNFQVYRL